MDQIGACEVLVRGGNDRAMGVFETVQTAFQPLHRDAAQSQQYCRRATARSRRSMPA